jgi:hypothetical protein
MKTFKVEPFKSGLHNLFIVVSSNGEGRTYASVHLTLSSAIDEGFRMMAAFNTPSFIE